MPEYGSVFSDEIRTHLSIREVELSSEAYRHYRRTATLFDEYLCRSQYHQLCWWFAITPPGSFVFPPKGGLTNRSFLLLVTA